jgi:hypothetical protein
VRTPRIVIYQGTRYRAGRHDEDTIELVSEDAADLRRGFAEYRPGLYVKTVRRTEIDEAYMLYTWAQFRGRTYPVMSVQDGKYQLFGDAGDEEFGFQRIDQSIWEGWVGPEELDRVWEERRPI